MFEGLMQPMHLLVILVIALLFFGPSKLGELGKGLGDGIRHFKNAMKEGSEPTASASTERKSRIKESRNKEFFGEMQVSTPG